LERGLPLQTILFVSNFNHPIQDKISVNKKKIPISILLAEKIKFCLELGFEKPDKTLLALAPANELFGSIKTKVAKRMIANKDQKISIKFIKLSFVLFKGFYSP
jgi:hypothetical protein